MILDKQFLKNRKGEKKSIRQFFSEVKEGMNRVTPLQQAKITSYGYYISGIGVIWGLVFSFYIGYYWMGVILLGGLIVLFTQFLANFQKKSILTKQEEIYRMASLEIEVKNGLG